MSKWCIKLLKNTQFNIKYTKALNRSWPIIIYSYKNMKMFYWIFLHFPIALLYSLQFIYSQTFNNVLQPIQLMYRKTVSEKKNCLNFQWLKTFYGPEKMHVIEYEIWLVRKVINVNEFLVFGLLWKLSDLCRRAAVQHIIYMYIYNI